jgi:hypothetical protein
MDRNEKVRQEFAQARARKLFQDGLADGSIRPIDRMGNRFDAGDMLLYTPDIPLVFEVADAAPVMDPNQPPGLIRYTLTTMIPLQSAANQGIRQLIKIGETPKSVLRLRREAAAGTPPTDTDRMTLDQEQPAVPLSTLEPAGNDDEAPDAGRDEQ